MGERYETGVVIVGTGFSGLGMAIQLSKAGRTDFVVLEKAGDVGGTWRDNTYPGCACDIQSHMYSFSFEQNPDWTRSFSPQQEIWDYLRGVTENYGLREHIRFGTELVSAHWDAEGKRWHLVARNGDEYVAKFVVSDGVNPPKIVDGPYPESKELLAGYRLIDVDSLDRAIEIAARSSAAPGPGGVPIQQQIEVRQVMGAPDPEV